MIWNHHRNTTQPTLHYCATTARNRDDVITRGKEENMFSSTLTLISFNVRKIKGEKLGFPFGGKSVEGKTRFSN